MFCVLQADWRERFYSISDNSKALQERLEEMRTNHKEKDNTISRLRSRLKELEEAWEKLSYKLSDNTNTRLQEENKMFQNVSEKNGWGCWQGYDSKSPSLQLERHNRKTEIPQLIPY